MPRLKGKVAIKFLDATQDDVAQRNILWRGDDVSERKLSELYRAMARLVVQRRNLQEKQRYLRKKTKIGGNPMARAVAKTKLRDVKSEIKTVRTKFRNLKKQIEKTLSEMRRS